MAIVLAESDAYVYWEAFTQAKENETKLYIPASVLVEAGIVAEQRNSSENLDAWLDLLQPELVPLDRPIAELARQAFRMFGRGRHKARLNFGDCMSYAAAKYLRLPLLYKGEDFRQTDILPALKLQ